ncbi:uncharacterized protein JOD24_000244 [Kroppenstedtia sanguinis]|uniref:TPM domain-containing protein n=1 Tax=Kroppenstedtia sanguinis TaxID=1380684 RepID=A0ABW4C5P8_9BACL
MRGKAGISFVLSLMILLLAFPLVTQDVAFADGKPKIYDYAGLLTDKEKKELETLATQYGTERKTDLIILTTDDTQGKDIEKYMQDFYDEKALGYDRPHGNCAILTINVQNPENRELYLAGFYEAEKYLDNSRLDRIRDQITPDLKKDQYYDAFHTFIETSHRYMGIRPGVDPDSIWFNGWFQLLAACVVGGIIVGVMAYNSGGRVTINERTYQDTGRSRVLQQRDQYLRTSVTKRRKPTNNKSHGGGGTTGGGHSHSGSRGSF